LACSTAAGTSRPSAWVVLRLQWQKPVLPRERRIS
jgi:hypothetical protein